MKIIYEDGGELECSKIQIADNYIYADDIYSVHVADCKEIVDDYHEHDYNERLKHHDELDLDYCDEKDMWEVIKYNAYDDEWKSTGIYTDKKHHAEELIKVLENK